MSSPVVNPQQLNQENEYILYDAAYIVAPEGDFFDADYWQAKDALLSEAQGRGAAWFFRYDDSEFVLRHYRRGGLVTKLSDDRYLWSGLEKTRAWREWHLLAQMWQQGLPVPRPVAARVQRHGLKYSADLVTVRLSGVQPLAEVLMEAPLSERQWRLLGDVIRQFHNAGIYHADLNARNILLDKNGKFFVIDFDKGEWRQQDSSWQQENVQRLERSLKKFLAKEPKFYFDDKGWQCLKEGYGS